jgi:hypothetical protein
MNPLTVAILAICAALELILLLAVVAILASSSLRERAWETIRLAYDFARNPWVQCQDCSINWNTKNGRQTFEAPTEFVVFRTCPDCLARAKKNLDAVGGVSPLNSESQQISARPKQFTQH